MPSLVANRDNASVCELNVPFLYRMSNLRSPRRSLHLISRPDVYEMIISHRIQGLVCVEYEVFEKKVPTQDGECPYYSETFLLAD